MEVAQEEVEVPEEEIDAIVERLRSRMAETVKVDEARAPGDGDIAVLDFEAFDEQGAPIDDIKADKFRLTIGKGETLGDFENLVKTLKPGEESSGPVSFPEDFFNKEFAGRTVSMRVKLLSLEERRLPDLDEIFAGKAGGFENMEQLRDSMRTASRKTREDLSKSAAQKKLLDRLLAMTDFPLPESMVEKHILGILEGLKSRLENQGKGLASLGKTPALLREEARPEAEMRARAQILLLSVARAKGLDVSEEEVDQALTRIALNNGEDFTRIKESFSRTNQIYALRDAILADKGMEEIYSKATVQKVPPGTIADEESAGAVEENSVADEGAGAATENAANVESAGMVSDASPPTVESSAGAENAEISSDGI
jgi:trigger factor